ncbi:hypothetical protein JTB14_032197 [Gonioctena quinquepunctata]|nr:hypothetical protein JTB14_032197 [Gonioctena quinquepunctata]
MINNLSDSSDNEVPLQTEFQESNSNFNDSIIQSFESETESESEHDDDDGDDQLSEDEKKYFYGKKNRYKWSKSPPASTRTKAENIIFQLPWLNGPAANNLPTTPYGAWSLLVTENILDMIVEHTNRKITDESHKYGGISTFVDHTDRVEMKALLGLLYLSGIFKSAHEDAENSWATDGTGRDIFRLTMSLRRFLFLLTVIRFDDPNTREARKAGGDESAPISGIFQSFIENCKSNYNAYRRLNPELQDDSLRFLPNMSGDRYSEGSCVVYRFGSSRFWVKKYNEHDEILCAVHSGLHEMRHQLRVAQGCTVGEDEL